MTVRSIAVAALGAALTTALITGCSGGSGGSGTTPTPTSSQSTSSRATTGSTTTSPTTSPIVETNRPNEGLPVLAPDPSSPALKTFSKTLVTDALLVSRKLALLSVSDTTLIAPKAQHTLGDYGSEQMLLTSDALAALKVAYGKAAAHPDADTASSRSLISLAFAIKSGFTPDKPIVPASEQFTPSLVVGLNRVSTGMPTMVVTGQVKAGIPGTASSKHGVLYLTRGFSYELKVTGDPDAPVLVQSWNSKFANTFTPDK